MADFLNNVVNKSPIELPINAQNALGKIEGATNLANNFNIPGIPKIDDPLKALEGKIPSKELADKAAAKFKELQDKFNNLKKTKISLKKPKLFKPKEIPIPKKFKKAELDKLKSIQNKIGDLKSQATNLADKAKEAADKAKNAAQSIQSQVTNLTSQVKNSAQSIQSQIGNLPNKLP